MDKAAEAYNKKAREFNTQYFIRRFRRIPTEQEYNYWVKTNFANNWEELMMNELNAVNRIATIEFKNTDFGNIRAVEIDNKPWFIGKDIAQALGYSNTRDALSTHIDNDDKADVVIHDGRQNRTMTAINESGLYSLILSSKLPTAKQFKRWVTSEVLPSIRKHDAYMTPQKIEEILINPDTIITLATQLKTEQEKNKVLENKARFSDAVAESDDTILVSELAKILNQNGIDIGGNRLYSWMRNNGYLGKGGANHNIPTQKSTDLGLFRIQKRKIPYGLNGFKIKTTPKVTGKGQVYFVDKFLKQQEATA